MEGGKSRETGRQLASQLRAAASDSFYFILADVLVWSVLHKNSEKGEKLLLLEVTRAGF